VFADRCSEFVAVLAYHYAKAEEWEKAQDYLVKAGEQASRIAADAEALVHYREAMVTYERVFGDRWDPLQRAALEKQIGEALFRRGEHQRAREYLLRSLTYLGRSYPSSEAAARLHFAVELARQAAHAGMAALRKRKTSDAVDPTVLAVCSIYDVLARIEFFGEDHQLYLLTSILEANWAEQHGYTLGMVKAYTSLGVMSDFVPLPKLADYYHQRTLELARALGTPEALGHAYLGRSYHEHHMLGRWDAAIQDYATAAQYFWEAGELRWWGAVELMVGWLTRIRGDLGRSLEICDHIVRVGEDAGDRQLTGWGLEGVGRALWQAGDMEQALPVLTRAMHLFTATVDCLSMAEAQADIAQCHLRMGQLERAIELFDEAAAFTVDRKLRGFSCTEVRTGRAEAYLHAIERAHGADRDKLCDRAKMACRAALDQVKLDRAAMPASYRSRGTYEWITGKPQQALEWWTKSEAASATLGARWEQGRTRLERGRLTQSPADVQAAEQIFVDLGAKVELTATRALSRTIMAR
jgi:tetratricopeptide (TPR) repeat protein